MVTIEEEFKKNPDLKKDDIEHIQEWMKKQPHLPRISDEKVALFLHSCYYRLVATKRTIENYYTIRNDAPEIFSDRDPFGSDVQNALETLYVAKLPGKTPEGYDVFISKLQRYEPRFYVLADIIKVFNMHADIHSKIEGTSKGRLVVIDMDGVTVGHMRRINLMIMQKNLSYLQDAMPVRLKGIHLLNVVPFIDVIMNMIKPFMKPQLQALFQFHQPGSEEIYDMIPLQMLPSDYNGDGESMKDLHAKTKKLLEENAEWFKEEELERADESKREGNQKPKNAYDPFGLAGSFKKLSFD